MFWQMHENVCVIWEITLEKKRKWNFHWDKKCFKKLVMKYIAITDKLALSPDTIV